MKKLILPVTLLLLGTGAAFATKMNSSKRILVDAYRIDAVSGRCVTANQKCSTVQSDPCTWNENSSIFLHDAPLTQTMCGDELYKP
ncbi:hypothetical protein SAMN05421841_1798 [Chryseobacterium wanjuense]|uniref:Uncharacterized protein n=1 Tax=Chryseobacterium wanjuense TaxID=356305 RepID=A0A1I0QC15_9FLAO|nr:DUF6520 family protein [Chryseobacterium wanjuense]SEW24406.1 hypothetical protein SAMN05421841_1798 [Chryseobacterium wanjuense]